MITLSSSLVCCDSLGMIDDSLTHVLLTNIVQYIIFFFFLLYSEVT